MKQRIISCNDLHDGSCSCKNSYNSKVVINYWQHGRRHENHNYDMVGIQNNGWMKKDLVEIWGDKILGSSSTNGGIVYGTIKPLDYMVSLQKPQGL